jgi:hypothetical protein
MRPSEVQVLQSSRVTRLRIQVVEFDACRIGAVARLGAFKPARAAASTLMNSAPMEATSSTLLPIEGNRVYCFPFHPLRCVLAVMRDLRLHFLD